MIVEITLYTHERPGAGLTTTNVCQVKGAEALSVVAEGWLQTYPLRGGQRSGPKFDKSIRPHSGKADLILQTTDQVNLANCQWAVALVVDEHVAGNQPATIYWIENGECSEIERCHSGSWARAQIEARHRPEEFELPPQSGS
jgi:hypothetical protein